MNLAPALRELFAHNSQTAIAAALTASGLTCDQTKVSAWLRGRVPTIEQLAAIEDWAGKPRGWILARSGYGNLAEVEPLTQPDGGAVAALERRLSALEAQVRVLGLKLLQQAHDGEAAEVAGESARRPAHRTGRA